MVFQLLLVPVLPDLSFVHRSASPVKFVDEATFPEFVDETKLDEVLHFGFGCSRIRERLDF
jgi:hypothetical protein